MIITKNSIKKTCPAYVFYVSLLLNLLIGCEKCKQNDKDSGKPHLVPITDEMIETVKKSKLCVTYKSNFLVEVLTALKNGKEVDINAKDPNGINGNPPGGYTALYYAAWLGDPTIIKVLLERKADVNVKDNLEETPLMQAVCLDTIDALKTLLAAPGIDVNAADVGGQTALYKAAEFGKKDAVEVLLSVTGIDVNKADKMGKTPLSIAQNLKGNPDPSKSADCLAVISLLQNAGGI